MKLQKRMTALLLAALTVLICPLTALADVVDPGIEVSGSPGTVVILSLMIGLAVLLIPVAVIVLVIVLIVTKKKKEAAPVQAASDVPAKHQPSDSGNSGQNPPQA